MDLEQRHHLEHRWHEDETFLRDRSRLIVGVYRSSIFAEAEACLFSEVGPVAGRRVLDYGCGTGSTTAALLALGAHVTGLDISFSRLQQAQRHSELQAQGEAAFVQGAAEQLPFGSDTFDAVLGKQVLHHLDWKIAIPEIARVLRPGGRAVFLEPLIHNPLLEGYRRLTPHLRSPTERALSMRDIAWMGSHFRRYRHQEFIFLSVLPVLLGAIAGEPRPFEGWQRRLQAVDRWLRDRWPALGRYFWETVITFEK